MLQLPPAFYDREPVILKLGPPIRLLPQTVVEQPAPDLAEAAAKYDPWFVVEKPKAKSKVKKKFKEEPEIVSYRYHRHIPADEMYTTELYTTTKT